MKIKNSEDWEAFISVCSENSFVRASKKLGISPAVLTKRIARLESDLAARLFQRTTRSLSLTQDGAELLPVAQALVDNMRQAEQLFEKHTKLSGLIRMTTPAVYCQRKLSAVLAKFQMTYPDIRVELELTNSTLNLIEERIDIAIRFGALNDSSLISRKIGTNELIACASPEYLKKAPTIKKASDLSAHPVLFLDAHKSCKFTKSDLRICDIVKESKVTCHDGGVLTALAVAGLGVAIRSTWDVASIIDEGRLTQVLRNDPLQPAGDIYMVIPSKRQLSPRVRELMNFISVETAKS